MRVVSPSETMPGSARLAFSEHLAGIDAEHQLLLAENAELKEVLAFCVRTARDEQISSAAGRYIRDTNHHQCSDDSAKGFAGEAEDGGGVVGGGEKIKAHVLQQRATIMEPDDRALDTLGAPAVQHVLRTAQAHAAVPVPTSEPVMLPVGHNQASFFSNDGSQHASTSSSTHTRGRESGVHGAVLVGDLKSIMKEKLKRPVYDVTKYYHTSGIFQKIAKHRRFEHLTMAIIAFYALWMAIDTDYNKEDVLYKADIVFQVAEHFFCAYFTIELIIRFGAFKSKCIAFTDAWFIFDFILVVTMVGETWVLTLILVTSGSTGIDTGFLGNIALLRMARLLRLTRLLRMAKLLKMVPELLIMIKAIAAAGRSVGFTLLLLILVLYIFAIAFTATLKDTDIGNELFASVGLSMHNLVIYGTLLDEISSVMAVFVKDSYIALVLMYVFIILSAITIMNMLVGVLCEVISAVAAAEREFIQVQNMKETLESCMEMEFDENGDGCVDRYEFNSMMDNEQILRALQDLDVDVVALVQYQDMLFEDGRTPAGKMKYKKLTIDEFMESLLQFRGSNTSTVKDIVDLRKWLGGELDKTNEKVEKVVSFYQIAGYGSRSNGSSKNSDEGIADTSLALRDCANGNAEGHHGNMLPNVPLQDSSGRQRKVHQGPATSGKRVMRANILNIKRQQNGKSAE